MTTNEERREAVRRLRNFEFEMLEALETLDTDSNAVLMLCTLTLIVCGGMEVTGQEMTNRLADLIEPEPERTCHMIWKFPTYGFYSYECSSCGEKFHFAHAVKLKFCPDCGAKVVSKDGA